MNWNTWKWCQTFIKWWENEDVRNKTQGKFRQVDSRNIKPLKCIDAF